MREAFPGRWSADEDVRRALASFKIMLNLNKLRVVEVHLRMFGNISALKRPALSYLSVSGRSALVLSSLILSLTFSPDITVANTSCDKKANHLRVNMNNAWRGTYRNHEVLRQAWHDSLSQRLFPSCNMSYDEYFGLSKRSTPRRTKPSNNATAAVPRNATPSEKKVNVDPDPDWAGATRDRILKGKQGDVVAVNQNPNRVAPYGSADCIEIKAAPNRGAVDWDYVILRNKCSYPIKVLTCYYDQGRGSDCVTKKGAKGWGQSDLLSPGETQTSVATSKKLPWFARSIVCDMREKSNLLCVLPD